MAVNLLEEERLVYHDKDGDTLEISIAHQQIVDGLTFEINGVSCVGLNRGAVETLRDSLTCWLETGKLTNSSPEENSSLNEFGGDLNG